MEMKTIYIADSEVCIFPEAKPVLEKEGFRVLNFKNGPAVIQAFEKKPADLLILDAELPEMDGFLLCSAIRKRSSAPIIIISSRGNEQEKIAGLTSGSDDYMAKPFSPEELTAKVKSIFRRIELDKAQAEQDRIIRIADLTLKLDRKQAYVQEDNLSLTVMEFNLLSYLAENRDRAVSRVELLKEIWGFDYIVKTRAADDMIKRIRKKLSAAGASLKITTVWGFGFKLDFYA